MESIYVAVQPNGEHLQVERWVYESWLRGQLVDPLLRQPLDDAVRIVGWWTMQMLALKRAI